MNIGKIINIKKPEIVRTNPNLFFGDSTAHKFKTFLLYYLISRAERGEGREAAVKLTLGAGVPERFAQRPPELNAPPAATSASQASSVSNAIAVAFDILGGA